MKRMMAVLSALGFAVLSLQGCATGTEGHARAAGLESTTARVAVTTSAAADVSVSTPPSEAACTDVIYADPWIAFESPLADGDVLKVGGRGWISTPSLENIKVAGTPDAVQLSEQTSPTVIKCGVAVSTVSWVEVSARQPGTVTLTSKVNPASTLRITVNES